MTMHEDAAHPGEKAALAVVAGKAFPGFEHRILRKVPCEGLIATKQNGLTQQTVFVQTKQRGKRRLVSAPRLLDEVQRLF